MKNRKTQIKFMLCSFLLLISLLQCNAETECQEDCSKTTDEIPICHADCDGINGCNFYDSITKDACTSPQGRVVNAIESYDKTHKLLCCEGIPYIPRNVTIEFPKRAKTIVRITRIVFWRGQFVRLIIDMFR